MKKSCLLLPLIFLLTSLAHGQTKYIASLGMGVDAYGETLFFGGTGKYFFSDQHVGQANVLFEENATMLTVLYSFHKEMVGARGLRWYAGAGPSIVLVKDFDNAFVLRPHLGLDFKPNGVPFVVNFDWRPVVAVSETGDGEAGAFGFGLQFTLN
nr:hypothetical protein [Allomuricauda sp.]